MSRLAFLLLLLISLSGCPLTGQIVFDELGYELPPPTTATENTPFTPNEPNCDAWVNFPEGQEPTRWRAGDEDFTSFGTWNLEVVCDEPNQLSLDSLSFVSYVNSRIDSTDGSHFDPIEDTSHRVDELINTCYVSNPAIPLRPQELENGVFRFDESRSLAQITDERSWHTEFTLWCNTLSESFLAPWEVSAVGFKLATETNLRLHSRGDRISRVRTHLESDNEDPDDPDQLLHYVNLSLYPNQLP